MLNNDTDFRSLQDLYIATSNATFNSDELTFLLEFDGFNDGIDSQLSVSHYILHIIILAFYAILILTSLISNPLLIYILLWKRKSQLKLIDVYVTNLSISDLFLTVFNIPLCLTMFFGGQWLFGTLMCKLGKLVCGFLHAPVFIS
jgi:hypothetical protein